MSFPHHKGPANWAKAEMNADRYSVQLFFEDEKLQPVYDTIVRKFLNQSQYAVYCLGGKSACIKRWHETQKNGTKNLRVFVVDKDLDDLLNVMITDPTDTLWYLNTHSIENVFLHPTLIYRVVALLRNIELRQITTLVDIDAWISQRRPIIVELVQSAFLAQKLNLNDIVINDTDFANLGEGLIEDKVHNVVVEISHRVTQSVSWQFHEEFQEISQDKRHWFGKTLMRDLICQCYKDVRQRPPEHVVLHHCAELITSDLLGVLGQKLEALSKRLQLA